VTYSHATVLKEGCLIRPKRRFDSKKDGKDTLRCNRRIRVPEVRLIGPEGDQLGVYITMEAIKRAEESGLDLVEISPHANPPVCKIMDYGRFKYEQSKKKHEQKKKQTVVHIKEIKMRAATDEHDFQTKLRHVKRFLEEGNKVKISIRFRGREMAHTDLGRERMQKVADELKEIGQVESFPKMEGRQLFMMLAPLKK
jgi:translation initiation factor IF-3